MRRKMLFACISIGTGILIWIYKSVLILIIAIIVAVLFAYSCRSKPQQLKKMLFIITLALLGTTRCFAADLYHDCSDLYQYKGQIVAEIDNVTKNEEKKYKLQANLITLDGKPVNEKIVISYYKELENYHSLIGTTISFYGQLQQPKTSGNPRTFDYRKHLRSQEIYFVTTADAFQLTPKEKSITGKIKSFIIGKRENFLCGLNCGESTKAFIRGVIFGDKSQLDEDVYEDFQNNGTAHILAVSGLHVGILYGIYRRLLKKHSGAMITAVFFLILIGYGTMTLWSVSVTRAICLVVIITIGNLLDRRYDLTTALALIGIILLLDNPYIIENTGFQMSFLAVASIGFIGPFLQRLLPPAVAVAIAVQVGMMPYTAYVFNYIPLLGIICNVPIIFFVSILVPLGLGCFFLSTFFYFVQVEMFNRVLCAVTNLLIKANAVLAQDGLFSIDVVSPKLWMVGLLYLSVFYLSSEDFIVRVHRRDKAGLTKITSVIFAVVIALVPIGQSDFDNAFLVFVDVGQGDCVHISPKGNSDILIDGGGNLNYNVGKNVLKPYLLKNGNSNVDLAMATHLHTDHYLGLTQLVECYKVTNLITKGKIGDRITIDESCFVDIIWPAEQNLDIDDENLNSLIFKINYKGYTVLVTGDITEEGEKGLINQYKGTDVLKSNVLKIGHHGSKYSTTDEFLEVVNPEIAVISVGKNNYGHPSDEVIEKLDKKGIMVFRTDRDGAVGLIERKGKVSICTKNRR